jgi:hypothetical protein
MPLDLGFGTQATGATGTDCPRRRYMMKGGARIIAQLYYVLWQRLEVQIDLCVFVHRNGSSEVIGYRCISRKIVNR